MVGPLIHWMLKLMLNHHRLSILLSLFSLLGVACSQSGKQDTVATVPENSENGFHPVPVNTKNFINQVDIQVLESFPAQVNVTVQGQLSNNCEKISQIIPEQEGNVFTIDIITAQQTSDSCQDHQVPFQQVIPLNVDGLKAGVYTVKVNGITELFELAVDNIVRWE
jgi:inhibitor of cysteine peptidase